MGDMRSEPLDVVGFLSKSAGVLIGTAVTAGRKIGLQVKKLISEERCSSGRAGLGSVAGGQEASKKRKKPAGERKASERGRTPAGEAEASKERRAPKKKGGAPSKKR